MKDPVLLTPRKLGASLWTGPSAGADRADQRRPSFWASSSIFAARRA